MSVKVSVNIRTEKAIGLSWPKSFPYYTKTPVNDAERCSSELFQKDQPNAHGLVNPDSIIGDFPQEFSPFQYYKSSTCSFLYVNYVQIQAIYIYVYINQHGGKKLYICLLLLLAFVLSWSRTVACSIGEVSESTTICNVPWQMVMDKTGDLFEALLRNQVRSLWRTRCKLEVIQL